MTPARIDDAVRVEQLEIAVSGIDATEARTLGESVARIIADRLALNAEIGRLTLGALECRVRLAPAEISGERLASVIVSAIEERAS